MTGSVIPVSVANRKAIQFLPNEPPIRHVLIHQHDETLPVRRLQQVNHFVQNDVTQAVLRFLRKLRVEPDRPSGGIAAPPLGLHLLDEELPDSHSEKWLPSCDESW